MSNMFASYSFHFHVHVENLIGNISNSIPDPPFLQDDSLPPMAFVNGELNHHGHPPRIYTAPEQTLTLTTDEDMLD